ncbi:MAG: hypothetical protein MJ077_08190 [Oscillospiraceae bacterium]|nr:hypothetical protein [Oscillospiraceae bacterium]
MILNIILLAIGVISLIFGIKTKLKLWIVIGLILIGFGGISALIDYKMMGGDDIAINSRLPFVIGNMMK